MGGLSRGKALPTRQELLAMFQYDATKGLLWYRGVPDHRVKRFRKVSSNGLYLVGSLEEGYLTVSIKRVRFKVHRIIWALENNIQVFGDIDHINGNTLDNRIQNLRLTDFRKNSSNTAKHRSGRRIAGVYPTKSGKYYASIRHARKDIYLGTFEKIDLAIIAYDVVVQIIEGKEGREWVK